MESKTKPLQIDEGTHGKLKKLSKSNKKPMKEMVNLMVQYFEITGIDPSDLSNNESSLTAIKAIDKRVSSVIAFIKKQEQDKLNPLLDELSIIAKSLTKTASDLPSNEYLIKALQGLRENQKKILDEVINSRKV